MTDAAERYSIEFDGFTGTVIGSYTTLEGKEGVVLQQDGTRVVHVYGRKHLKPAPVAANASAELSKFANDLAAKQEPLGVQISAEDLEGAYIRDEPTANASAEARLREALEKIAGSHWERVGRCQTDVDDVPDLTAEDAMREARKALSAQPHASDCDKQGWLAKDVEAATKRVAEWKASDRTADVTVDELAAMIVPEGAQVIGAQDAKQIAAEILDTFTVGRR